MQDPRARSLRNSHSSAGMAYCCSPRVPAGSFKSIQGSSRKWAYTLNAFKTFKETGQICDGRHCLLLTRACWSITFPRVIIVPRRLDVGVGGKALFGPTFVLVDEPQPHIDSRNCRPEKYITMQTNKKIFQLYASTVGHH